MSQASHGDPGGQGAGGGLEERQGGWDQVVRGLPRGAELLCRRRGTAEDLHTGQGYGQ